MKTFAVVLFAFGLAVAAAESSIDECLTKDSISCVQKTLFRKAREFFDKDEFDMGLGLSLVKAKDRSARSGKDLEYEQEVEQAPGVAERQNAIENFISEEASDFIRGRSLRINFAPAMEKISNTARALTESVPSEVREAVDEVASGRGKKKIIKKILPLLLLAKAKLGALATLAYFAIALIAKKAILVSLISIAISAFIGLKSVFQKKLGGFDTTGYSAGGWNSAGATSGGWSSGGYDDSHGGYSAQSQAYSGYH